MQTTKQIRRGITYVKTVNSFSTTHTFMSPKAGVIKNAISWEKNRHVKCVVVASRKAYDEFKRKGHFYSAGIGARMIWLA